MGKKRMVWPVLFFALFIIIGVPCPAQKKSDLLKRPRLVVGIVVDQMRWDYLYRYNDRYTEEGFRRLLREGFTAENAYIDYVPTVTGIGHASVYTGTVPSIHGIAGNHFIEEKTGNTRYCVEDSTVTAIGNNTAAGKMSPRNLLSTTITDELKLATNFRSKVIGVALKDRASILPAGHAADAAYWFDGQAGKWITSSWYRQTLPVWVHQLNEKRHLEAYACTGWHTVYPIETYIQSTADNNSYEGPLKGATAPVFPVNTAQLVKAHGLSVMLTTPYGNTITMGMAKAAVLNERMGKDDVPDFLTVSFSSTDFIGHQFGTNAIEVEDTYLRLDRELADFFTFLDTTVGKGEYTVFLTADHGAAHNVEFLKDHKLVAGGWEINATLTDLNRHLQATFGTDSLVLSLLYYQVHFNQPRIRAKGMNGEAIKAATIAFLKGREGVAYVIDTEQALLAPVPALLRERVVNGFHQGRSGTVQIVLEPGWFYSYGKPALTGSDHSSWNPYDSHIPVLFMGWGIKPGKTNRRLHMSDIAPTVAALLQIQEPNGCIGSPIEEALK